jgi:hypothetical protein
MLMQETLLFLLLNSLYINGLRLAFEEGMIFEKLNDLGEEYMGKMWMPIAGCVTCMASVHSWPYLVSVIDWTDLKSAILEAVLYICALAAVNTIIYKKLIDDGY